MAIKPDKQKSKKGTKKSIKKKDTVKKDTYNLTVPTTFSQTSVIGQTILNKQNTEIVAERKLKGRVFEVFQGDINPDQSVVPRKLSFIVTKLRGKDCKSVFNGIVLTTDKQKSIVKKWHTLIESYVDIVTKEDIRLRIFLVGVSKRTSAKRHAYLKPSKVKQIRQLFNDTVSNDLNTLPLDEIVRCILTDKVDKSIEEIGSSVSSLQNCYVRKVKVVKRPREILEE